MKKYLLPVVFIITSVLYAQAQVTDAIYNWAKSVGATNAENSNTIAVDASGNVYIAGYFFNTVDLDPGAATATVTAVGNTDIFFAKYDASGNYIWGYSMGSPTGDIATAIALDASANIYLTGYFVGTVDFDPGAGVSNVTSPGNQSMFMAKYTSAGAFVWAQAVGGAGVGNVKGNAIALDASNNVYLAGYFSHTADFDPGAGTANLTTAGTASYTNLDAFIAKYDNNGVYQWAESMGSTLSDVANGIAIGDFDNVYVTGTFQNTADFDPSVGTINLTSAGNQDIFLAKYDHTTGAYMWAKGMGGTQADGGLSVSFNQTSNKCYLTGSFSNTVDLDPGAGVISYTSTGGTDMFFGVFDVTGSCVTAKAIGGFVGDAGESVYGDASGNIYITGYFATTVDFDPGAGVHTLVAAGLKDIFFAKYNSAGNYLWARNLGGNGDDIGYDIAVTPAQDVYVTGIFSNTADFNPGTGTANLVSAGSNDVFFAMYNYCTINSGVTSTASCAAPCTGKANVTMTGGTAPYAYLWSNNNTTTAIANLCPGTYSVTVSEAKGCTMVDTVVVSMPAVLAAVPVCLVTVDSLSKYNIIAWEKPVTTAIDSFIVYREISTGNYQPIAALPYSDSSSFVDTVRTKYFPNTGDPNNGTYRYKIRVKDTCGNFSPMSYYHNTIFTNDNGSGTFSWAQLYTIENTANPVNNYVLMRDDSSNGKWKQIASVAGTQQQISDPAYSQFKNTASWRVYTQWAINCHISIKNPDVETSNLNLSKSNINRVSNPIAVQSLENFNSLQVYSNPSNGKFTVECAAINSELAVYNMMGEKVYAGKHTSRKTLVDVADQPAGVYFLEVSSENGIARRKVIISK